MLPNASLGVAPPKSVNSAIQIAISQYGAVVFLGRMKPFRESREKVVGEKPLPTGMIGADS